MPLHREAHPDPQVFAQPPLPHQFAFSPPRPSHRLQRLHSFTHLVAPRDQATLLSRLIQLDDFRRELAAFVFSLKIIHL